MPAPVSSRHGSSQASRRRRRPPSSPSDRARRLCAPARADRTRQALVGQCAERALDNALLPHQPGVRYRHVASGLSNALSVSERMPPRHDVRLRRLWRDLGAVDGFMEGASIFGDSDDDRAYFVNGTQVANIVGSSMGLRLTRSVISENRARLKAEPKVDLRRSGSDWIAIEIASDADCDLVLELAPLAACAHWPRAGAALKPPARGRGPCPTTQVPLAPNARPIFTRRPRAAHDIGASCTRRSLASGRGTRLNPIDSWALGYRFNARTIRRACLRWVCSCLTSRWAKSWTVFARSALVRLPGAVHCQSAAVIGVSTVSSRFRCRS